MLKRRLTNRSIGCGYIITQGTLLCLLLVINGYIVRSTINLDWGEEVRITQAIQFVLPVVMIFIELFVFDLLFAGTTRNET